MTTKKSLIGAASTCNSTTWNTIAVRRAKKHVFRLQIRIAKAMRERKTGKVKALQRILTHSFYAKFLAIKQVTSNNGKRTPGVDGEIWSTNLQKIRAIDLLKRRGYKPLPLRRIYISKKQSKDKKRPLSIPVMKDRAMQALWLLALYPIAEELADPNTYGFRSKRSTQDAIEQCFINLGRRGAAKFVLEGDIKSCFDQISHDWLLKNVPMDKVILQKFLTAQFMEKGSLYPTTAGIPQGGIISPCLTLITLSGLENKIKSESYSARRREKIHFVGYADDFVITAADKEMLNKKIIPIVKEFLMERGLELSKEKTKITHIEEGFDFLGFNIRKYNGKLLTKPSKGNVKSFLNEIKETIKSNIPLETDRLIYLLNKKIIGWCNYYKSGVSSKIFSHVDSRIFKLLYSWAIHRHPNKGKYWITKKYFTTHGLDNWSFYAKVQDKHGNNKPAYLKNASSTKIKRHVKIRADANPFDLRFKEYFERLKKRRYTESATSLLGDV